MNIQHQLQTFSSHISLFLITLFSALTLGFFMFMTQTSFANTDTTNRPGDVDYQYTNTAQIDVEEFGQFAPEQTIGELAQKVLTFLMAILGGVAMLGIIAGGIMVMSGGVSEDTKESGKKLLFYSIIGVSVAILSMVIVTLAQTFIYSLGE